MSEDRLVNMLNAVTERYRFANTAVNILTDICTVILPLPVLKSLNLPKRQRSMLMVRQR